jgi:hypothetical protein
MNYTTKIGNLHSHIMQTYSLNALLNTTKLKIFSIIYSLQYVYYSIVPAPEFPEILKQIPPENWWFPNSPPRLVRLAYVHHSRSETKNSDVNRLKTKFSVRKIIVALKNITCLDWNPGLEPHTPHPLRLLCHYPPYL